MLSSTERGVAVVGDFFRWWRAELSALVPERVRFLSRQRGRLVVRLDGTAPITLAIELSAKSGELGRVADPTATDGADQVRAILQQANLASPLARGDLEICLRLPARSALIRTIDLPLAAEGNLSEVVGYELDRYTPFRAEQVYYGHRVVRRDAAGQRVSVEVTLVPKPTVDEALALVRSLGLAAERVDVADRSAERDHSGNLLVQGAGAEARRSDRLTQRLAAVAVLLALVAVAVPFVATQRKAAAMTEEAAAFRTQMQASEAVQKELEAIHGEQDFLVVRKGQTPTVSSLLLEVTRILPDDTWLTEFRISGAEVQLAGVTASASVLIALLERSGVFRNTSFRSPVMTDPNGRERFSIAAEIVEKRRP